MLLETSGTHLSQQLNEQGDLAIVLQAPIKGDGPVTITKDLLNFIAPFHARINGVYVIHPFHPPVGKAPTMRELRKGWAQVQLHLSIFGPNVKRVLLMGDSNLLRVAVPALALRDEHGARPGIDDAHGMVFTLPEYELVPTWEFSDYSLRHKQGWMERDRLRFEKLTKPSEPLPYVTYIPNTFEGKTVVVDLETSGLDATTEHIISFGLQWSDTERAIISDERVFEFVKQVLTGATDIVFHNGAFDLGFLGERFRQATYGKIRDTIVRARARGELVAGLKHLGSVYTSRPGNYAWIGDQAHSFDDPSYITEDLDVTWRLYKLWSKDTSPIIELMERSTTMVSCQTAMGTAIDSVALDQLVDRVQVQITELREELTKRYGCDPSQTDVLATKLRTLGHPLSKKTDTGKDALTAQVLEDLGLVDILEYRRACKLDSAFCGKIKDMMRNDNTITHHQTLLAARTGRTTMKAFNFQQLPKKGPGKSMVVSQWREDGLVFNCDLKQAELRIAAYLCGDIKFIEALQQSDMHTANAARGFDKTTDLVTPDERFQAKSLVFRAIYGGSAQNPTQERVLTYMKREFKDLFRWIEIQKHKGQTSDKVVDALGKSINLLDILDYKSKWAAGRVGINGPIQGLASHLAIAITLNTWELFRDARLRALVNFGVHDSLVGNCYKDDRLSVTASVQQAFRMLNQYLKQIPLLAKLPIEGELQFGRDWADIKNGELIVCSSLEVTNAAF